MSCNQSGTLAALNRPRILLVDDVEDNRDLYREYLEFKGYQVMTAVDGREAVALALAERPDIVLMDLRMPGMTGQEAMIRIKAVPSLASIPVVALTAHALHEERRQAMAAGFDAFIPKPCLPDDLVTAVNEILRSRKRGTPPPDLV
jgi:two-component system, cell cycle response regulator DivK